MPILKPFTTGPRLLTLAGVLAMGLALLAMACGGSEAKDSPSATKTPADDPPPAGGVSFDISMGDNFFEANEITVSPGQTVTFNIVNDGQAIHNMRVAGPDGEYGNEDDALSQPDIVRPGETATLTWTVPTEPGTYIFQCDFHPVDMTGTIVVQ
jgi:plastocyanin